MLAALAESFPGAITEAVREMPLSAVSKLKKGLAMAQKAYLEAYPDAIEETALAISRLEKSN